MSRHGSDRSAPWPRIVDAGAWQALAEGLGGAAELVSLWAEPGMAHMALRDSASLRVASLACPDGAYPAVSRFHAPALRLERTIRDLWGLEPVGLPDPRPWLDHGRWGIRHPLGAARPEDGLPPYRFLEAEGEGLHEIPVGPVHAGIIEPGHFRFTANGETVVRLEERLGYTHKGIEGLMRGAPLMHAARLAGRMSGDSTVAYALAFARAVESALGIAAPPRAAWLRGLMAELERLANHLGDIGAICNDAAFALMPAHCGILRERVLRACDRAFGHRLMMDRIVPGGAADLAPEGAAAIAELARTIDEAFPELAALYDDTTSLQDRTVGTGVLAPDLARLFGAGGVIGRASGRDVDARRLPGYPPYDALPFEVPVLSRGDVDARVRVRIREVGQSLDLIGRILANLPGGPVATPLPRAEAGAEGMALIEGFRGDVFVWLRLGPEREIAHCHLRDPSWFQWPLLEAAIEGNIVADFPICNKSFNCSYSGHDR